MFDEQSPSHFLCAWLIVPSNQAFPFFVLSQCSCRRQLRGPWRQEDTFRVGGNTCLLTDAALVRPRGDLSLRQRVLASSPDMSQSLGASLGMTVPWPDCVMLGEVRHRQQGSSMCLPCLRLSSLAGIISRPSRLGM
jgi:hypothetical protein